MHLNAKMPEHRIQLAVQWLHETPMAADDDTTLCHFASVDQMFKLVQAEMVALRTVYHAIHVQEDHPHDRNVLWWLRRLERRHERRHTDDGAIDAHDRRTRSAIGPPVCLPAPPTVNR